jgi:hypothetical protein
MSRPFSARFVPCAGLIAVLVFAGCGGGPGYVTGKVTFRGKPLNSGAVTFYGEDGRVDSGAIRSDGTYVIPSAPPGTVKVTVSVGKGAGKAVAGSKKGPGANTPTHPGKDSIPPPDPATPPVLIPPKYEKVENSGLTFTVTGGKQTIDIPLS